MNKEPFPGFSFVHVAYGFLFEIMSREHSKTATTGRWTNNGGKVVVGTTKDNWYSKNMNAKRIQQRKDSARRMKPHLGLESIAASNLAIEALAKVAGIDVPDAIVKEIEGGILLLTNLSQQTNAIGVMSAIGLHLRCYSKTSVTKTVMEYISELFPIEEQSGSETISDQPAWLSCLRSIRQNWQLCKNNRAFVQISKMLGILVVLGLCKASDLEFNIGQFRIFAPTILDRHLSAADLADAVCETVLFFAEGMYLCFKSGSLKPLLLNDRAALELDDEFVKVVGW